MCVHAACANTRHSVHLRTAMDAAAPRHPARDPLRTNLAKPWQPYSWLFELLSIGLFQRFGWPIVGYSAGMVLAITVASGTSSSPAGRLSSSSCLTFATCYSMGHLYTPRPWLFTSSLRTRNRHSHARSPQPPPARAGLSRIFRAVEQPHIQFIDGLLVLRSRSQSRSRLAGLRRANPAAHALAGGGFAGSVAATFINPFGGTSTACVRSGLAAGVLDKSTSCARFPSALTDFCVLSSRLRDAALAYGRASACLSWLLPSQSWCRFARRRRLGGSDCRCGDPGVDHRGQA